jgi:hypothetical protein
MVFASPSSPGLGGQPVSALIDALKDDGVLISQYYGDLR